MKRIAKKLRLGTEIVKVLALGLVNGGVCMSNSDVDVPVHTDYCPSRGCPSAGGCPSVANSPEC